MAYITLQQVRDAGLDATVADDAAVNAAIVGWQEFIDRATDQFFEPRAATVVMDGTDSDTLHFGVPIITVTSLKINNSDTALDPSLYKVYNNNQAPNDDRRNPRIKLVRSEDQRDIFSGPIVLGPQLFRKGRQNQEIIGTFGFTEPGGVVPYLIQRALLLLVIEKLANPIIPAASTLTITTAKGPILEENTDGHKLKYQAAGGSVKASPKGLRGITENPEILDILKLYKAPLRMATPANWSYH